MPARLFTTFLIIFYSTATCITQTYTGNVPAAASPEQNTFVDHPTLQGSTGHLITEVGIGIYHECPPANADVRIYSPSSNTGVRAVYFDSTGCPSVGTLGALQWFKDSAATFLDSSCDTSIIFKPSTYEDLLSSFNGNSPN